MLASREQVAGFVEILPCPAAALLDHRVEVVPEFLHVVGRVLQGGAEQVMHQVLGPHFSSRIVPGVQGSRVAGGDGLRRAHGRRQLLQSMSAGTLAGAQFVERRDQHLGQFGRESHRHAGTLQQPVRLALHQGQLLLDVGNRLHRLEVEPAFEGGAHLVDAAVARVGRGDDVEPGQSE